MKKINRKWLGAVADAKKISIYAAAEAVLSEPGGIWTLKEQRAAQRAYLGGEEVFSLLLTGFGKSLIKHHNTSRFTTVCWHMANFARRTNTRQKLLLPGSTESKNKNSNYSVLSKGFLWALRICLMTPTDLGNVPSGASPLSVWCLRACVWTLLPISQSWYNVSPCSTAATANLLSLLWQTQVDQVLMTLLMMNHTSWKEIKQKYIYKKKGLSRCNLVPLWLRWHRNESSGKCPANFQR